MSEKEIKLMDPEEIRRINDRIMNGTERKQELKDWQWEILLREETAKEDW